MWRSSLGLDGQRDHSVTQSSSFVTSTETFADMALGKVLGSRLMEHLGVKQTVDVTSHSATPD